MPSRHDYSVHECLREGHKPALQSMTWLKQRVLWPGMQVS